MLQGIVYQKDAQQRKQLWGQDNPLHRLVHKLSYCYLVQPNQDFIQVLKVFKLNERSGL